MIGDISTKFKRNIYIPDNLALPDIEPIFTDYREDALYFVHLLYRQRIFNKKYRDDFIPLKKKYLRRQINMKILDDLISALKRHHIIESDGLYIRHKKSYGYRLNPSLRSSKHSRYKLANKFLLRRISKWNDDGQSHKPLDPTHLGLKYNIERLNLDIPAALAYVSASYSHTLATLHGNRSGCASRQRTKALARKNAQLHYLDAWSNGDGWFTFDDYGRVHTPLTSMYSGLRQFVSFHEPLYEVDIVNSQPLIFACLMVAYFANGKKSFAPPTFLAQQETEKMSKKNNNNTIMNTLNTPSPPHHLYGATFSSYMTDKLKELQETTLIGPLLAIEAIDIPPDGVEFIRLCETGMLYEALQQEGMERNKVKKMTLKAIFQRRIADWLVGRFPTMAMVANKAKETDYKHLSHLLQRTESSIIIHGVAANMIGLGKYIATIHDSVVVMERDISLVISLIEQEFAKWDLSPSVRVKRLTIGSCIPSHVVSNPGRLNG